MRVTQLRIKNYRSFGTEEAIDLPSTHVVLVGGNNVGKSNIIKALDLVLGSRAPWQIRLEPDDYFDASAPVELGVTIGEVSTGDKSVLFPVCTNKQQRGALSSKTEPEITIDIAAPAWEPADPDNEGEEDSGPTRTELDVNLWGFPVHRGGNNVRKALARTVVVSPHRRVDSDLSASRWTPYGQLMKDVLESSAQFDDLRDLLKQANEQVQAAFSDQKDDLLDGARIVSYVEDIEFRLTEQGNPVELLRNLQIFVDQGRGRSVNLDHLGTGTQSAVIIGILELALRSAAGHVRVMCVEEPEAFIHPHGIRRLGKLLRETAEQNDIQIILASHSPSLVATLTPADIIRVEVENGETTTHQADGALSDPHFARFVTADTAEMFFAKRVVLVEGDTERFLLPPLSSLVKNGGNPLDLDRDRISIISMNTKDNVLNYLKILNAFSIDAWAILDADFLHGSSLAPLVTYLQGKGASIDNSNETNLRKDLLAQQVIVLSQGEIEDYISDADVAAASGKSLADVQATLASHTKRSSGFKAVFGTGKPQYAMTLAGHYLSTGQAPADLERLLLTLGT